MTSLVATMNNNGPPHDPRPFGYTFNYSDPFADPSDIPVNGPPLLNSNEHTFLGDFFGNPAGFQFDFGFNLPLQQTGHSQDTDLNWLMNEPAPTLLQATAAAPKVSSPPTNSFQPLMAPSAFGFHTLTDAVDMNGHDDVLATASMMDARTGQQAQLHISPQVVSGPAMSHTMDGAHSARPPASILSVPSSGYDTPHSATTSPHELVFPHSFRFESTHNPPPLHAMGQQSDDLTDARLYRFGSDTHFTGEGFRALHENETNKHIEKTLLQDLYILQPVQPSASNTRAPTPEPIGSSRKRSRDGEDNDNSVKRRKGLVNTDGENGRRSSSGQQVARNGNGMGAAAPKPRRTSSMESGAGAKRRRSSTGGGAGGAKPPRENLSEEQKRSNHIMSEQKRRNLIKSGFDELHIIVPELRQGGLSKSNVLVETANFLERILSTNKELMFTLGIPT